MAFAKVPLKFESLLSEAGYFDYNHQPGYVKGYMDQLNAPIRKKNAEKEEELGRKLTSEEKEHEYTTCAIQMSHAFNTAGQKVPAFSQRRTNVAIPGGNGHYIHAVDEMEDWLTVTFGSTDDLKQLGNDPVTTPIMGKKGVLVFGRAHVEFWQDRDIVQNPARQAPMHANATWNQARILFWEIVEPGTKEDAGPASVSGWWTVYDGNYYYYYFALPYVVYTKTKPSGGSAPSPISPANRGKVTATSEGLKITWNPIGASAPTIETFTRVGGTSTTEMNGLSNKYAPLFARKIP